MSIGKPRFHNQDKAGLEASIEKLNRSLKEWRNFDVSGITDRWDSRLEGLQKRTNVVLAEILGLTSQEYKKHAITPLDATLETLFGDRYSSDEFRQGLKLGLEAGVGNLTAAKKMVQDRLDGLGSRGGGAPPPTEAPTPPPTEAPAPPPTEAPAPPPTEAPTPAPTEPPPPPTEAPTPAPTPAPTAAPTPPPTPAATPKPTPAPTPAATAKPTPAPTPAPTPRPPPPPPPPPPAPPPTTAPPPAPAPAATAPSPTSTPASSTPMPMPSSNASSSGRVAVVGRLDEAASEATGFIEQFGLDAVVLQNVASGSDGGLIERLDSLREVAFAVVLLSEADRLHLDILLEVGFLFGSLGRSKICFILTGGAALPGELGGVMNYPMDENGLWKLLLAREMRRAGLDVDLNRAL